MNTIVKCVLVALGVALGGVADATTYYVATDGKDDGSVDGKGSDAAFASIAKALESAEDGDTIKVAAGTYGKETTKMVDATIEAKSQFFAIVTKAVTIEGEGEDLTILDGTIDTGTGSDFLYHSRGIYLNHPQAVVRGLAVTRCQNYYKDMGTWVQSATIGMALEVRSGTVENCRIFNNQAYHNNNSSGLGTSVIYLQDANSHLNSSVITNNGMSMWGKYAPLYCNGATVSNCVIAANFTDDDGSYAGGVSINNNGSNIGLVSDCVITNNYVSLGNGNAAALVGGVRMFGGVIERCYIAGNRNAKPRTADYPAGGLYATGNSIVRNCIFEDNDVTKGVNSGAAAVLNDANAVMYHCTIVGNKGAAGCGGLVVIKGTAVGVISFGNNACAAATDLLNVGGSVSYSCYSDALPGDANGNINTSPKFTDPDQPYVPMAPGCRDSVLCGSNLVTDDYNGKARPAYDEAAEDRPDMGAIECEPIEFPLSVEMIAPGDVSPVVETTFEARTFPEKKAIKSADWTFASNTGFTNTYEDVGLTPTVGNLPAGLYDVTITVTPEEGEAVTQTFTAIFRSLGNVCYVATDSTPAFPYATPATAAPDLKTALDSIYATDANPGTVHVMDGEYPVSANTYNVGGDHLYLAYVTAPVRIVGNAENPEGVHLNYSNGTMKGGGFYLAHPKAVVTGVTVSGTSGSIAESTDGMAFWVTQGATVSNCVVSAVAFNASSAYTNPYVTLADGLVRNVRVSDCSASCWCRSCLGILVSGGLLENALVTNVVSLQMNDAACLGVQVAGGTARNVVVRDCESSKTSGDSNPNGVTGLLVSGGVLENSAVSNCFEKSDYPGATFAGLRVTAGTARNCLVANCASTGEKDADAGAGLDVRGGTAYNVTGWGSATKTQGVAGLRVVGGTLKNTIVWGGSKNGDDPSGVVYSKITGGTVACCCYEGGPAEKDANGNFAADPLIRKAAKGDYRIGAASPCANVGDNAIWGADLSTALDLSGNRRLVGRRIDLGAYEAGPTGVVIMFY